MNGSRYVTIHKPMTFYGAQDACRDQGGHLAHVNNVREQVFLEEYLKQIINRNSEYMYLFHSDPLDAELEQSCESVTTCRTVQSCILN